jgi:hypothetical protein
MPVKNSFNLHSLDRLQRFYFHSWFIDSPYLMVNRLVRVHRIIFNEKKNKWTFLIAGNKEARSMEFQ